ncbi:Hypothetical predicted protein [Cloeon dipterum]|uniref:Uncharacterized protein n=1 Tax=Cloeon dipterum TaxID=197152 RepID=A0A8S1DSR6_9INSE|nr:Hypothetical predicted protein [Cloeon dipterum]
MSSKKNQDVCSVQSLMDIFSSAAQYLWSFFSKTPPTKAENEDSAQMTSNKRCVYCRLMFDNHGIITPFNEAEAELVTKMCSYHRNKVMPRIILSEPQDPGQICGQCTVVLRYYMQECFIAKEYKNELRRSLARRRKRKVFANIDENLSSEENCYPAASSIEHCVGVM